MSELPWHKDDEKFKRLLREGRVCEDKVRWYLEDCGFEVEQRPLTIRRDISEAHRWRGSTDLRVRGHVVEVKGMGSKTPFTDHTDWPHPVVFVDDVGKWRAKEQKPVGYVFLSKVTGALIWTPGHTDAGWEVVETYDSLRGSPLRVYAVGVEELRPMETLVNRLKYWKWR